MSLEGQGIVAVAAGKITPVRVSRSALLKIGHDAAKKRNRRAKNNEQNKTRNPQNKAMARSTNSVAIRSVLR